MTVDSIKDYVLFTLSLYSKHTLTTLLNCLNYLHFLKILLLNIDYIIYNVDHCVQLNGMFDASFCSFVLG